MRLSFLKFSSFWDYKTKGLNIVEALEEKERLKITIHLCKETMT